jgi:hypothetical protein
MLRFGTAFSVICSDYVLKAQNIALFVVKWILMVIFAQKAQDNA